MKGQDTTRQDKTKQHSAGKREDKTGKDELRQDQARQHRNKKRQATPRQDKR
jgi:hypothetical protein